MFREINQKDTPQLVKIILSGRANTASLNFIILTFISSNQCASLGLKDLMNFRFFSLIRLVATKASCGISLPVSMVVQYEVVIK